MRVLCVDGEEEALDHAVALCREHPVIDEAVGVKTAEEAIKWLKMNRSDLVLLGIELPDRDGIELAAELRKRHPRLAVVFLAKNAEHALRAYGVHPQNYLLKPLDRETLDGEINYYLLSRSLRGVSHIEVKTFGSFEITVDGSALSFKRSKAKELLALLVDKQGAGVSREQAFTEMWEDREYDRKAQKYFDVVLHSLHETLAEYHISEIFELRSGFMRIRPELIDCDRYRFAAGETDAINAYQGIYMYGYPWAYWNGVYFK